jgi:hypothetical protein
LPGWGLALAALRYVHLAAGCWMPSLRQPLPTGALASWRRKTIGPAQSGVLVGALIPATPPATAGFACAAVLGVGRHAQQAAGATRDAPYVRRQQGGEAWLND